MTLLILSCQSQDFPGFICRWVSSHSGLTSTVGTQPTASAPHFSSWALSANTLQDTISMRREGLPVTPIIVQRHVGSLAKVSICQMGLGNACVYMQCMFPVGAAMLLAVPAPKGKPTLILPLHASCLHISLCTHAPHSRA